MRKTIFQKWEEVKSNYTNNKKYITQFYLSKNSKANIYFGINTNKMHIYLEFLRNLVFEFSLPTIKGMKIIFANEPAINPDSSKEYLIIENETNNEEIFEAFSSSLADALESAKTYFDIYQSFDKVVKEYKDYFANPNKSLSKQEEQGLCAELLELTNLILLKDENVINNWQGPSKNKRDFVFEKSALEVKSTLNQENSSIKINNENQLDFTYPDTLENLFLKVFVMEESNVGININSCIDKILNIVDNISLKNNFIINLLKLKVDYNTYKAKYNFSVQKEIAYKISNGFPCITSKNIPHSIFDVSYRLKLDDIVNFQITEDELNGEL